MTSKERMKSWKALPRPKPSWEDWKRILNSVGGNLEKASRLVNKQ